MHCIYSCWSSCSDSASRIFCITGTRRTILQYTKKTNQHLPIRRESHQLVIPACPTMWRCSVISDAKTLQFSRIWLFKPAHEKSLEVDRSVLRLEQHSCVSLVDDVAAGKLELAAVLTWMTLSDEHMNYLPLSSVDCSLPLPLPRSVPVSTLAE